MRLFRFLLGCVLLSLVILGIAYSVAGRTAGPTIVIHQPNIIGRAGALDVTIDAPRGQLDSLTIQLEQPGQTIPVLRLDASSASSLQRQGPNRVRITHPIGKDAVPQLVAGQATVVVTASRPVLWGLRTISSRTARDVPVRLEPPHISVVSTHHYINQGGAEMVVYRVTPLDVSSGVRVGDLTYPGFPASGAGVQGDPALKVAFFALLYDQNADAPMELYARDAAGNEAGAQFEHRVFPKKFRQGRIELDDAFLARVVPRILEHSPELRIAAPSPEDLLPAFLKINGELRQANARRIEELARDTSPMKLWEGAFRTFSNSQVESSFADDRTYAYRGKPVDRQVHLGFDLARTAHVPIVAANHGKALYAGDLGIYGNCVILDHGMGVQSLYAHLSSLQVSEGQDVQQGQTLGLSGETGLAAGDHLHFSMLVNGRFTNATEWWDPHWIVDRVMRKLRDTDAPAAVPQRH
jgi:murein DD-endopeptidase MepM/ murein hydrolase activator NlpD